MRKYNKRKGNPNFLKCKKKREDNFADENDLVTDQIEEAAVKEVECYEGREVNPLVKDVGDTIQWNEGRRIVELGVLAEQLSKCGEDDCEAKLDLRNIVAETISGFGSYLWIKCSDCGQETKITTGKVRKSAANGKGGRPSFDINTKSAAAVIHVGAGAAAIKQFMETIEVGSNIDLCSNINIYTYIVSSQMTARFFLFRGMGGGCCGGRTGLFEGRDDGVDFNLCLTFSITQPILLSIKCLIPVSRGFWGRESQIPGCFYIWN